ncbi:TPA: hypothetical protein ACXE8V_004748, partial [Pluralibacter gergoviae]
LLNYGDIIIHFYLCIKGCPATCLQITSLLTGKPCLLQIITKLDAKYNSQALIFIQCTLSSALTFLIMKLILQNKLVNYMLIIVPFII